MKKLQFLALSMLLSTPYITKASDTASLFAAPSEELSKSELRKLKKQEAKQAKQDAKQAKQEEAAALDENSLEDSALNVQTPRHARHLKNRNSESQFDLPPMQAQVMPVNGPLQKRIHSDKAAMKSQALDAIGSPLSPVAIASYADQLPAAIAGLSDNPTREELQQVKAMLRNIAIGLRALHANASDNAKEDMPRINNTKRIKRANSSDVAIQRKNDNNSDNTEVVTQSRQSSEYYGGE